MKKIKFKYLSVLIFIIGSLHAQIWTHIGPPGGGTNSISINQTNPSSLYASTTISGLFHSLDSGQTVSVIPHQFGNFDIADIIQLGSYTESFVCNVRGIGYFKWDGLSGTWTMLSNEKSWNGAININPKIPDIIFISKNGSELRRSNDGGKTWSTLHTFGDYLKIIEISKSDTSVMYAAIDNAIYKSINSGKNWIETSEPDVYHGRPFKLFINPFNDNSIYLHNEGRLLKSTDSGFSFDTLFTGNVYTFAVNTLDTLTLYVGTGDPVFAPDGGIVKSIDGGLDWFEVRDGLPEGFIQCYELEINQINPDELYAGFSSGGIFKTINGGVNWQWTNLANTEVLNFELFNTLPGRIAAIQGGYGIMLSENEGDLWYFPNYEPDLGTYPPSPNLVAINTENSNIGFLAGYTSLYKTINGGKDWVATDQLPGVRTVRYHVYNPNILLAGSNDAFGMGGHFRSFDGAGTWERLENEDILPTYWVFSPHNQNIIYGHGYSPIDNEYFVAKSSNIAETWELINDGLLIGEETNKLKAIFSLAISDADSNILYCGQKGGLSKSIDGGDSWFQVNSALPIHDYFRVSSILLDQNDPDRIYIGTLSSGTPYEDNFDNGGLYLSEDDCQSWTKVYDGEVTLIKADQSVPSNVYINTQHGILTFEDTITKINGKINADTPKDYLLYQNYPNPCNLSTIIKFSLPVREQVKVSLYNAVGEKVETILNKWLNAGNHYIEFNAKNISSGIYFYQIEAGKFQDVKKLIFLK